MSTYISIQYFNFEILGEEFSTLCPVEEGPDRLKRPHYRYGWYWVEGVPLLLPEIGYKDLNYHSRIQIFMFSLAS